MYEGLINTIRRFMLEGDAQKSALNGKDNVLTDGKIKLVSRGNITFEGKYVNAETLEKKISSPQVN